MPSLVPALLVLLAVASSCAAAPPAVQPPETETQPPAILATGIDGALVVCGWGPASDDAIARFLSLAGSKDARAVVVRGGDRAQRAQAADDMRRLVDQWEKSGGSSLGIVRWSDARQATEALTKNPFAGASGIWLSADAAGLAASDAAGPLRAALAAHLKSGGVIATAGDAAKLVAALSPEQHADANAQDRSLLPGSVLELVEDKAPASADGDNNNSAATPDRGSLAEALRRAPWRVGFRVAPGGALVVRGRSLWAAGSGKVSAHLAGVAEREARTIELSERRRADLTALRRAGRDRALGQRPPAKPAAPVFEHGTLIIVGGGGMPRGLLEQFVERAGGKDARIVVLPISMPDPLPARDRMSESLRRLGAGQVTVLDGRTPEKVNSQEYREAFRTATGIWFGGGRQWRFVDAYEQTECLRLMHDVLRRGGVIAGSSAGATIQGDYLARGNPLGPSEIIAEGYERGFGFLPGVAIDQHFTERKRQQDMTELMAAYPQFLGIGIDEATALVVSGHEAQIVGRGGVSFYDATRDTSGGQSDHQIVRDGGRYDLRARKILDPGKPDAKQSEGDAKANP